MTANPDATLEESGAERSGFLHSGLMKTTLTVLASIAALFFAGIVVGVIAGVLDRGTLTPKAGAALVISAVLAVAAVWYVVKQVRRSLSGPISSSTRKTRFWTMVAVGAGALFGMALSLGETDRNLLLGGSALEPWAAITLAVAALVIVPAMTVFWWRALDEHEAAAYSIGALIALNFYFSVTASWWVLWRGGFAEPVGTMTVFLLTTAVWSVVWAWKRYR